MRRVEVHVQGQIDPHWGSWFEDLQIAHPTQGQTVLIGMLADQAALYGLLARLRDLGLELISVSSTEVET